MPTRCESLLGIIGVIVKLNKLTLQYDSVMIIYGPIVDCDNAKIHGTKLTKVLHIGDQAQELPRSRHEKLWESENC